MSGYTALYKYKLLLVVVVATPGARNVAVCIMMFFPQ